MGIKCELCGVGLKNVEARREGIKFHRFPVSRPSVCKQWLETAGKPELHLLSEPNLSSRRICSRHFASTDYKGPTTRLLYHYAVPMKECSVELRRSLVTALTPAATSSRPTSEQNSTTTTNQQHLNIVFDTPITQHIEGNHLQFGDGESRNMILDNQIESKPCPSSAREETCVNSKPRTPSKRGPLSSIGARSYKELTPRKVKLVRRLTVQRKMVKQLRTKCKNLRESKEGHSKDNVESLSISLRKVFSKAPDFASLLDDLVKNVAKSQRGRRWNPEVKALALALYKRGPRCYRTMQQFMDLPSPRTLTRLLNSVPFPPGIGEALFKHLADKVKTMGTSEKICSVMFDEMSLSAGLHYNVVTDQIDGYEDYGHLGRTSRIADHALVFMVRGLFSNWKQPVAYYFCQGTTPTVKLKVLIKYVINALLKVGLNVVATVCDQGSTNCCAIRELRNETRTDRPGEFFMIGDKQIVTIFDPPHLLKTTRNNVRKYGVIYEPGKKAEWKHLVNMYEIDSRQTFRSCHRLTDSHIHPVGFRAMRVKYAAQVFSRAVAATIKMLTCKGGNTLFDKDGQRLFLEREAEYLGEFCGFMDRLFDSFNGKTGFPEDGKQLRCRLSVDSAHWDFWNGAIGQIKNWVFKNEKGIKVMNKVQEGWINNIHAVRMLWNKLSRNEWGRNLSLRNLNQDVLENLFGCIRQNGCQNTNPTCWQFVPALKTSIVNNLLSSSRGEGGNCLEDDGSVLCNLTRFLSHTGMQPTLYQTPHEAKCFAAEVDSVLTSTFKLLEQPQNTIQERNILSRQECSAAYIAGYLARKILNDCPACRSLLVSPSYLPIHSFIQLKENNPEDPKLILPSPTFTKHISVVSDMLLAKLGKKSDGSELLQELKVFILSNHDWTNVGCPEHSTSLLADLVIHICSMWIYHFCKRKNEQLRTQKGGLFEHSDRFSPAKKKMKKILHL